MSNTSWVCKKLQRSLGIQLYCDAGPWNKPDPHLSDLNHIVLGSCSVSDVCCHSDQSSSSTRNVLLCHLLDTEGKKRHRSKQNKKHIKWKKPRKQIREVYFSFINCIFFKPIITRVEFRSRSIRHIPPRSAIHTMFQSTITENSLQKTASPGVKSSPPLQTAHLPPGKSASTVKKVPPCASKICIIWNNQL